MSLKNEDLSKALVKAITAVGVALFKYKLFCLLEGHADEKENTIIDKVEKAIKELDLCIREIPPNDKQKIDTDFLSEIGEELGVKQ